MTGALHLLYTWRSPVRRRQDQVAELGTSTAYPEPDVHRRRREQRHERLGGENAPSRTANASVPEGRNQGNRRSHKQRESGRIAHNVSDDYWPGDNSNVGVSSSVLSSLGLSNTEQLPGAVVEARARLLERLRGVSLAENRQCSFHYDVLHNKSTPHVDNDASNATFNPAIPKHFASSSTTHAESTMQMENLTSLDVANKKKFPTIEWDAFHMLKGEVFASGDTHETQETGNMGSPLECGICLERFKDGDWLIKLCCSHKFHSACLEPWVRSCGDCPYCRADIVF
ncbi:hypothetical protein HPP92_018169 [Vanilla planifolia]|uniref:RING-type domain-containing protein n=1 Tax=Vanilla planifolia TaxID=51239 RepID=A0A835QDK2_VANPL|nr:hypothetical protein HPP92_018169 [Vanilla planifolia]